MVPGLLRDEPVHVLTDRPVGRMTLGGGAQFDEMHRLAGVEMKIEPHLVGQR